MLSRCPPLIMVMQSTQLWDFLDRANLRPLDRPRHRTIHLQRPVCAPVMIIGEVFGQEPPQMALVQTASKFPFRWWGVNSTLPGKHQLDRTPGPRSTAEETLDA